MDNQKQISKEIKENIFKFCRMNKTSAQVIFENWRDDDSDDADEKFLVILKDAIEFMIFSGSEWDKIRYSKLEQNPELFA